MRKNLFFTIGFLFIVLPLFASQHNFINSSKTDYFVINSVNELNASFLLQNNKYENKLDIIKKSKSNYKIIISLTSTKEEKRAATIIQDYLKIISKAELPILTDNQKADKNEILIGITNRNNTPEFMNIQQSLKEDGYWIKTKEQSLIILGGSGKGVIYGVTGFLEDYLGCRKYSPTVEFIPRKESITLDQINDMQIPPANIRIVHGSFSNDENYKDWRRLAVIHDKWGSGDFGGYYVHTFNRIISKEIYFESHPEYFSLVNGKRIFYGQLCLSNPEVLKITIEKLQEEITKYPEIKYWSVSQNDTYENCECANCKAIDEEEGSPSGLLLRFVNQIAKEFPDKIITTLAYQYTRKPPIMTKPDKNVMITLCTIELNRSEPIETDTSSTSFRDDIIGWSKICNMIKLWDYEVQFTNYFCPFPLFHTLQPNIQFFTKYNVIAHFQQCNASHGVEFSELKSYLLSKLLWNPDADANKIIDDFMSGYYQQAGKYIREYFDLLHLEGKKAKQRLDIYGTPVWYAQTYLSKDNIAKYNELLDKAEQSVNNKKDILERVKIARLPVRFSEMEIAKNDMFGERGWYKITNGKYLLRSDMKKMLDDFYATCKNNSITHLNESGLTVETYYQNTLRFIDVEVEGNLAFQKLVTCNPLPDKKYFGLGPSLLTNGVKGTDDYKINWLGWEDQDCEIIVDLRKTMRTKEITISTLQLPKVWILHPLQITCFLSEDGQSYKEYKSIITEEDIRKEPEIKNFTFTTSDKEVRSIKFKIIGTKKLPNWHNYGGNKSWVFVDEIIVK